MSPERCKAKSSLSTSGSALQDGGAAAPPCETQVRGWGAPGAAVDARGFCFPRFPERKHSQERNVPEEQGLAPPRYQHISDSDSCEGPADTMGALSGAGRRCPVVTACWHPGTPSQCLPSWATASSCSGPLLPACCPCLLEGNAALCTSGSVLSARWLIRGFGLAPSRRGEIPKDLHVLHPLMIVFQQELCHGTGSDLFSKTSSS